MMTVATARVAGGLSSGDVSAQISNTHIHIHTHARIETTRTHTHTTTHTHTHTHTQCFFYYVAQFKRKIERKWAV